MTACEMCRTRGQTWSGDAPRCAFPDGQPFTTENWNCATANAVRDLFDSNGPEMRNGVVHLFDEDMHYGLIALGECNSYDGEAPRGTAIDGTVYIEWYKSRGRTDEMWIMSTPPARPTEAQVRRLLAYYAWRFEHGY